MGYQLLKHLRMKYSTDNIFRQFSHSQILVPLKHRKLLKVSGGDAPNFLQGLITNDMRHFDNGEAKSIYAMFLNNKSRVLYDTLIYKWENENNFLIECDASVLHSLQSHLKLFKLKQAVNVEDVNKNLDLWALISPINKLPQPSHKVDASGSINIFKDPRLVELGCRILTVPTMSAHDIVKVVGKEDDVLVGNVDNYRYLRYKLGVGEGVYTYKGHTSSGLSSSPLELDSDVENPSLLFSCMFIESQ